jgi:NAD dependent epimerase/dehydratase family enzyme
MRSADSPPPVWVRMSTAHIYGDPPELTCDEDFPFGSGFAPFVGRAWEKACHASAMSSQRKVILRTSFVMGRDRGAGRGALARLLPLVRLGWRRHDRNRQAIMEYDCGRPASARTARPDSGQRGLCRCRAR